MGRLDLCGTSASEVPLNLLLRVSPRPSDIQIASAPRHLLVFLDISLNLEMTPLPTFATLDSTKLRSSK